MARQFSTLPRRRFAEIVKITRKSDTQAQKKSWVAKKAVGYYKQLYKIERDANVLDDDERYRLRQQKAVPVWDEFIAWAQKVAELGVGHAPSRDALKYLLGHQTSLRAYCMDGRLPISNIQSEHVAKTIALARKNFLFADTPAGASASAMIYSLLETAKANKHHVFRYMSVVLSELPKADTAEQIESLLPWNLLAEDVSKMFADLPTP